MNVSGDIRFFGLLTILLIVLKLTNYIGWSWWLVFAPVWFPLAIFLFLVLGLGLVAAVIAAVSK